MSARWDDFLGKLAARLDEVLGEARVGLDALVEEEVIDPTPLASAGSEVRARLFSLHDKVDAARQKLAHELDDRDEDRGRALQARIRDEADALEAWTRQRQVARLKVLSEAERAARVLRCVKCGGPLREPETQHRTVNVTCLHCDAVNTVRPSMATATYFSLTRTRPG